MFFSFLRFRQRGNDHPDGWGIGRYDGKDVVIIKEAKNSLTSDLGLPGY